MTVHTVHFDRVACLPVDVAIAVRVLLEMAVGAVHPFLKMDVHQVHRRILALLAVDALLFTGRLHRSHQLRGAGLFKRFTLVVE